MKSHLGEPDHLTGTAHLHMNSPLIIELLQIEINIRSYKDSHKKRKDSLEVRAVLIEIFMLC